MKPQTLAIGPDRHATHLYRSGRGMPLLYLHHFLGLIDFEAALVELAGEYDVIAPFAPGWGPAKDDLPRVDVGPLDLALHHVDLLDALEVSRAHVVGIGIGAWMAAELAAIAPARVERLVLVNPLGMWLPEVVGEDPFAQHPGAPSTVLFADPSHRREFLFAGRDHDSALIDELLALRSSAKFLWPIMETGVGKRLGRIRAPTLVVTSSHDAIVPAAHGPIWQKRIKGARLATLAGAGHVAELEQPAAFAKLVGGFLADTRVAHVA